MAELAGGNIDNVAQTRYNDYCTAKTIWGCSSVGRALEWHSRGQGFDSPHLHQKNTITTRVLTLVVFCFSFGARLAPDCKF